MPTPVIYQVLRAHSEEMLLDSSFEFTLFSDARIIGELTIGPLSFINQVFIDHQPGLFRPALVVRCPSVKIESEIDLAKTNTEVYHGGGLFDEVAALLSLALGFRVRAGQVTRQFANKQDQGRPVACDHRQWPESRLLANRQILPYSCGDVLLDPKALNRFAHINQMKPSEVATLLKAARSYQQALWIGEWEPEQAWLQLVSAIEVAASGMALSGELDAADLLAEYDPKIKQELFECGGNELVAKLAPALVVKMGATRKFCEFIGKYFPDEPRQRPKFGELPWNFKSIKPMLQIIYAHRSRALHAATPFPEPMCRPPTRVGDVPSEVPFGLASAAKSGVWRARDIPMFLHPFAHLVRGVLLKWWLACAGYEDASKESATE